MTTHSRPGRFEDRLLEQLKLAVVESPPPEHAPPVGRRGATQRRRLALAAVPLTLAAAALVVVPSLGGRRSGIAEAAVLARAAQALDQPGTILYAQVDAYDAHSVLCVLGTTCIHGPSAPASDGISADPATDTLSYSEQEWLSPDRHVQRELFGNGDETVVDADANTYEVYDAGANTLTTLSQFDAGSPAPSSSQPLTVAPVPSLSDVASPAYYESLYQEALAGEQDTQLVGETTVDGRSVYEVRFTFDPKPPADPPPGDMCGASVCVPPGQIIDVYLDGETFVPVRTVTMLSNPTDRPGLPAGTTVDSVVDFDAQALPGTPANGQLLQMSPHPDAVTVTETAAQYRANLGASLRALVAATRARASR